MTSPCVYIMADKGEEALRIGESQDLWEEYKGARYVIEAAMQGSGNNVFVAEAPANEDERKNIEANLVEKYDPPFNLQKPLPRYLVEFEHHGEVPKSFARDG